jgi:molybdenum cofactor cytidylyltransferase
MVTHILLLAAGSSSRMGQSKQLLCINGEPLLARAAKTALLTSPYVTVVLGAETDKSRRLLEDFSVHVVENSAWQRGMGSSIKAGLKAIHMSDPPAGAVLVMLCDQPGVTPAHLKELIATAIASQKAIVTSAYNDVQGVPAVFKSEMFHALAGIGDDSGAAKLIKQHADKTGFVVFPEGAIDLDTPEDIDRYLARSKELP